MKKSNYLLFIFVFLTLFAINPIVQAQYPTYQCAATLGGSKILRVTTVDPDGLNKTMGPTWSSKLQSSFGNGCNVTGARNKAVIIGVYPNETVNLGLGPMNVFIVETEYWLWTTLAFNSTPDVAAINVTTLYDPTDLQDLCFSYLATNVSMYALWHDFVNMQWRFAADYLTQLPVPAADYLASIDWEPDWTVDGLKVTYSGPPDGAVFINEYSATWEYDSVYGAFIRYTLKDNESQTIYQFAIELPSAGQIPGFELPILLSVTFVTIVCVIYIMIKRK